MIYLTALKIHNFNFFQKSKLWALNPSAYCLASKNFSKICWWSTIKKTFLNTFLIFALFFTSLNVQAFSKYYKSQDDLYNYRKSIVIDTREWTAKAYYYWLEIWEFPVSVWNRYNPTPHWRFKIINKNKLMLSKWSWLLMPNWMEFYWNWKYWLHWFPLYSDKTPKYLNEEIAVTQKWAWWCVRLKEEDIKTLYWWTDLLTTVIII